MLVSGPACVQFAFLAFFIGQSLEGFRQWKRILHLVLSCEAAPLRTHAQLYEKLLDIIKVCHTHPFHREVGENLGERLSLQAKRPNQASQGR